MTIAAGTRLGAYEILALVDGGGMDRDNQRIPAGESQESGLATAYAMRRR
jgi:hypothetical protein